MMNSEKAAAFLEELKTNPKAAELLKNREQPKTEEERILAFAEAAKTLGYDLTPAKLADYLKAAIAERQAKTDAQAAAVQKLSDSEAESVSGGKTPHEVVSGCKFSFEHRENCMYFDACDQNYQSYVGYHCAHNDYAAHCGNPQNYDCDQFVITE